MSDRKIDPLERLLAFEEIKKVFAERLRCMDAKEWHIYPTLHTEGMVSEAFARLPGEDKPPASGRHERVVGHENVTATVQGLLDGRIPITSVHHGHTPIIDLTSENTARAVWAMEDHLWWDFKGRQEQLHGYGHYHEEYQRVGDRWLISYRTLTRLRVDHTPGFYAFPHGS